jgi:RNA polymerase sigma factor (sigma-70 family)
VVTSSLTGSTGSDTPDPTFDDVFCKLLDRLYRRAAMLVGTRQSAEDAVHEVYLKLAARPGNFLSHPEPYAYAFSSLLSVIRDIWRRERRQVLVADVEFTGDPGPSSGTGGAAGTATAAGRQWDDGGLEQRSAELETVRLLRQLSVRQAGVVILVDLDGYTIDQAAKILGLHRGTVARTRRRALDKLRGALPQRPQHADRSGGERHAR